MREIISVNELGEKELFIPKYDYKKLKDKDWDSGVRIRKLEAELEEIKDAYNLLDKKLKEINHG